MAFGSETALGIIEKLGTFITDDLLAPLEQFRKTLDQVTAAIIPFVDAIAPSTVQAFGQALKDMQATIGSGLVRSLQILTDVVREVSGAMLPLVQKMEPVLTSLAASLGGVLASSVRVMIDWVTDSANLFKILSQVLEKVTELFEQFTSIIGAGIRTFTKVMGDLFGGGGGEGGGLQDALKYLTDVVQQTAKAFVELVANLLALAGFRDTLQTFASSLEDIAKERDKRAPGLTAAARNPQFADIGAIMRQQQLSAFNAAGAGAANRPKNNTAFLAEIANSVKGIANVKKDFREALFDWWKEATDSRTPIGQAIEAVTRLADRIGSYVTSVVSTVTRFAAEVGNRIVTAISKWNPLG